MNLRSVTCPLCGHRFDPSNRGACGGCPLVRGCETYCCPACGYVDVDPSRTTTGRWLLARGLQGAAELAATGLQAPGQNRLTLVDVPVGWSARIAGIDGPSASRKGQMRAYGLLSGDWIRVIQHRPVTVAVVDHTELALEADLARCILVDACEPSADGPRAHRLSQSGVGRGRRWRAAG